MVFLGSLWVCTELPPPVSLLILQPPSLTILKTARVAGSNDDCPVNVGSVCELPLGTFSFTYVLTGTVNTVGTPAPANGLDKLTITDTGFPAGLTAGTLSCSTTPPPPAGEHLL